MILRSLMIRGLVERLPDPGHSSGFLYRMTFDALKHLGVPQNRDLPDFDKFQELLKVFEPEQAAAVESAPQETPPQEGNPS